MYTINDRQQPESLTGHCIHSFSMATHLSLTVLLNEQAGSMYGEYTCKVVFEIRLAHDHATSPNASSTPHLRTPPSDISNRVV